MKIKYFEREREHIKRPRKHFTNITLKWSKKREGKRETEQRLDCARFNIATRSSREEGNDL